MDCLRILPLIFYLFIVVILNSVHCQGKLLRNYISVDTNTKVSEPFAAFLTTVFRSTCFWRTLRFQASDKVTRVYWVTRIHSSKKRKIKINSPYLQNVYHLRLHDLSRLNTLIRGHSTRALVLRAAILFMIHCNIIGILRYTRWKGGIGDSTKAPVFPTSKNDN